VQLSSSTTGLIQLDERRQCRNPVRFNESSGSWEPDDSEAARLILAVMMGPPKPAAPRPLSRLQREVAQEFRDVQRWARR